MSNKSGVAEQIISAPKGGGAMHGIGEKFSPDLHTGTGNFTVPIALPPGRNGFQPQLNLVYSTGNGNGYFGLGWHLSIPGIGRKISKGVPRYHDFDPNEKQDVFILSGAEDLVPFLSEAPANGVTSYRPRTEGLFAQIERIFDVANDHDYWRIRSKDGLVSIYGTPGKQGTMDPAAIGRDTRDKFTWNLTSTQDPFGNKILYSYGADEGAENLHTWKQPVLEKIEYAFFDNLGQERPLVAVIFNYDDRQDPYSDYRAGFEIRTTKRCGSISVETNFDQPRKVRAYKFTYDEPVLNRVSLLTQVDVIGYDDQGQAYDGLTPEFKQQLPPLTFSYSIFDPIHAEQRDLIAITGQNQPPAALGNPNYEMADITGDGLPDILEMNGTVRYWRNLGKGQYDWPRLMRDAPPFALADVGVQMLDANGNGRADLLVTNGQVSGYYPLRFDGIWDRHSFQPYPEPPSFNLEDPEVKLVDLDGDGITDVIRSGTRLECFFNDADRVKAWQRTRWVERKALDIFPNVNFSDPRVKWGDMSGDGLQDIVLVHDGNIEYWPNLGYGNWGKRIHMHNSPRLRDHGYTLDYDPKCILIGDVDGDGLADIVYVNNGKVVLWINQSGNGWSDPVEISGTPPVTDMDSVRLVDLLGTGVAGVLWSSEATFNGSSLPHMFFLDFTGGVKPYLLNAMDNHLGATTLVNYEPSTHFYLEDSKKPETRWRTHLPFPVQVVARVEVIDAISRGKLSTVYIYHHGYWDGDEREFRGFGMVEQRDTETFEIYQAAGLHGETTGFEPVQEEQFSPPILTRTWFHQGPIEDASGEWHELGISGEWWQGDRPVLGHDDRVDAFLKTLKNETTLLTRRDRRHALRALRGSILRTEMYALDGTSRQSRPYTITESAYDLAEVPNLLMASDHQLPRIFFPHAIAQRTTQWERGEDPMSQFSFTDYRDDDGQLDPFGRPQRQTQIACPRGWQTPTDRPVEQYLATRSCTMYAAPLDPQNYLHDRVARVTTFEITQSAGKQIAEAAYLPDNDPNLKILSQAINYYDGQAFIGLPLGKVDKYGVVTRTESLIMTDEILQQAYGAEIPPYLEPSGNINWTSDYPLEFRTLLPSRAGYTYHTGSADRFDPKGYFVNATRRRYDFQSIPAETHYGLVLETLDPLHDAGGNPQGHRTLISYDEYQLLPKQVTDAAGLTIQANYNHRVLQPSDVTDPNGNKSYFVFSPIGLLESSSVRGKSPTEGDQTRPSMRLEYEFFNQPIFVRTIHQIHHDTELDVPLPERDETITTVEYSDGFGRLLQTRTQGEDVRFGDELFGGGETVLPAKQGDGPGGDVIGRQNNDELNPNVVVSGWQIYDNKGKVVEKYEPFFSEGWQYARPADAQFGQKVTIFYDPRGHAIRTLNPDGSEQLVIYGVPGAIAAPDLEQPDVFEATPWEAYTYDANDNAGRTHPIESAAYRHHWNTPASILIDALGRTIEAVERNRDDLLSPIEELHTRTTYDMRGNVLTISDALGRIAFEHTYDYANRRLRIDSIDAGLRQTVPDAAGGVIEQRDSKGARSLHSYDILNRPFRLWARDGKGQKQTLRERLEYGDAGIPNQPAADRAANRLANLLGRLIRYYDEAGLLTFETYDFKGNLLEKTRRVVSDTAILEVFNGPPPDWKVDAFRVDWTNPDDTPFDSQNYTSTVSCDALSRVKLMTYPEDVENRRRSLRPHYNRAGALDQVALERGTPDGGTASDTFVERIAYNAKGQRVLIAYGNGVMTRQAYDPHTFRLLRLRSERYTQPEELTYRHTGEAHQELAYEFDKVGNIWKILERTSGSGILNTQPGQDALDREFTYDALYRLRTATGRECDVPPKFPWDDSPRCTDPTNTQRYTEQYLYDLAGNIEQLKHTADSSSYTRNFTLAPGNNRLSTLTVGPIGYNYEYDVNGNMTQENTSRHFEWDYADRMRAYRTQTETSEPSVYAHYLYDAGGQRVKKLVRKQGGQVEVTVYIDGVFEYQRVVRVSGVEENNTLHVMDNQSRIALVRVGQPFTNDSTPAVKYQLGDHLGSSNLVMDNTGNLVNREEYTPYGETSFGSFAHKRYRFTGKERDEESRLCYHGARYQAPWMARWISCDPLGSAARINPYLIFGANPVNRIDPTGLVDEDPTVKAQNNATGPTYKYEWSSESGGKYRSMVADTISINGDEVKAQPATIRPGVSIASTPDKSLPSTETARPSISELRQERWEAAKSGMQSESLDMLADTLISSNPATGLVMKAAIEHLKPASPALTGDRIRDLELQESYGGGGTVVKFAAAGVSMAPIGEIAEGAHLVASKVARSIPVIIPIGVPGGAVVRPPGPRLPNHHEHHIFPQQYRKEFSDIGIAVDEHTISITARKHQQLHRGGIYNWEWENFFEGEGANPTYEGAFDLALDLLHYHKVVGPKSLTRHYGR